MVEPKIFSVGQINRYIKNLLENDFILGSLLVKGEISNFKNHTSGHLYFTLKDAVGALSCVMFQRDAALMPFEVENGMDVILYGHISLYEKTGQYQLYVEMIEPLGIGALQLAYDQLKQKLMTEGLFDSDFKRDFPTKVETIALVTSPTGAAVQDMIQIIKRRDPRVKIAIFPSIVQGNQAGESIVEALKLANEWKQADVIIVGRGGGSIEDLWAFNEEKVARAIFASETFIISAVGHETDTTIADFVSDLRAPTPSAAAELATEPLGQRLEEVLYLEKRLDRTVQAIFEESQRRLWYLKERPVMKRPLENINQMQVQVGQMKDAMTKYVMLHLQQKATQESVLEEKMTALSPLSVMKRGYAFATTKSGKHIHSIKDVELGDTIELQIADGHLQVEVQKKVVDCFGET
ncbi:exodeoxyribonuclease VII large subunit [Chakrabartyella piscis]|uniref:exodeoxyribonuclease VII large subunit n=1 Tax=Chakrabartyella piscis TaxID=2918914 RepID=UPI0029586D9A|nr:exodeoxyribonuclease VII large subunit [Chakrabartyella piscis]